jgi:alcohol dehydrogenase
MRFNLPERQAEFAAIARLLGEDTSGLSVEQSAERAIAGVERLKAEIGIPARLSDLGITAGQIPILAEKALAIKRILRVNPRPVSQPDIEQIFRWAL